MNAVRGSRAVHKSALLSRRAFLRLAGVTAATVAADGCGSPATPQSGVTPTLTATAVPGVPLVTPSRTATPAPSPTPTMVPTRPPTPLPTIAAAQTPGEPLSSAASLAEAASGLLAALGGRGALVLSLAFPQIVEELERIPVAELNLSSPAIWVFTDEAGEDTWALVLTEGDRRLLLPLIGPPEYGGYDIEPNTDHLVSFAGRRDRVAVLNSWLLLEDADRQLDSAVVFTTDSDQLGILVRDITGRWHHQPDWAPQFFEYELGEGKTWEELSTAEQDSVEQLVALASSMEIDLSDLSVVRPSLATGQVFVRPIAEDKAFTWIEDVEGNMAVFGQEEVEIPLEDGTSEQYMVDRLVALPANAEWDEELETLAWTDEGGKQWLWDTEAKSIKEHLPPIELVPLEPDRDLITGYFAGLEYKDEAVLAERYAGRFFKLLDGDTDITLITTRPLVEQLRTGLGREDFSPEEMTAFLSGPESPWARMINHLKNEGLLAVENNYRRLKIVANYDPDIGPYLIVFECFYHTRLYDPAHGKTPIFVQLTSGGEVEHQESNVMDVDIEQRGQIRLLPSGEFVRTDGYSILAKYDFSQLDWHVYGEDLDPAPVYRRGQDQEQFKSDLLAYLEQYQADARPRLYSGEAEREYVWQFLQENTTPDGIGFTASQRSWERSEITNTNPPFFITVDANARGDLFTDDIEAFLADLVHSDYHNNPFIRQILMTANPSSIIVSSDIVNFATVNTYSNSEIMGICFNSKYLTGKALKDRYGMDTDAKIQGFLLIAYHHEVARLLAERLYGRQDDNLLWVIEKILKETIWDSLNKEQQAGYMYP